MIATTHFTYRVIWSPEDEEHAGLCTEFPLLSWLAPTPEEALAGIRRLVDDVVADMERNGKPIPEPLAERRYSGRILFRTTPAQHRALVIRAAEEGVSLNRYLNAKLPNA